MSVTDGSITVTGEAEKTVRVTGTVTANSIPSFDPTLTGVYVTAVVDAPGVVAANTFIALYNPPASGLNLYMTAFAVSAYVATDAAVVGSVELRRFSGPSGGVDSTAGIVKVNSASPTPSAQVFTSNPTVTLGNSFGAVPPPLSAGSFNGVAQVLINAPVPVVLAEGEGILWRTAAGDVDQRWNLGFTWVEIPN